MFKHTYLLSPWSRVLLEKLTGSKLIKKFPAFYGTRSFITAFTGARHLFLSWASSIHYMPPHLTSWRSILLLSSHLRLDLKMFKDININVFIMKSGPARNIWALPSRLIIWSPFRPIFLKVFRHRTGLAKLFESTKKYFRVYKPELTSTRLRTPPTAFLLRPWLKNKPLCSNALGTIGQQAVLLILLHSVEISYCLGCSNAVESTTPKRNTTDN